MNSIKVSFTIHGKTTTNVIDIERLLAKPIDDITSFVVKMENDFNSLLTDKVAPIIHAFIQERFDTESDPYGYPWEPLSPITSKRKAESGYPLQILRESLDLMGSFKSSLIAPQTLRTGSDIPYFLYHQIGAPANNMPARVVLDMSPELQGKIMEVVNAYVVALTEQMRKG